MLLVTERLLETANAEIGRTATELARRLRLGCAYLETAPTLYILFTPPCEKRALRRAAKSSLDK